MKEFDKIFSISFLTTIIAIVGIYYFLPVGLLENKSQPKYGSTITTINGTDTLSSSRSVINTNFANLNTDKIEATQTTLNSLTSATSLASLPSLSTIGTITSGIWHGTALGTQWGGTGSTTLSANQILLGNGTGNILTVAGWGTSGQALISNGGTLAPTWQSSSFDATQNYAFSGNNSFSGISNFTGNIYLKNLIASSTITISNGGAGVTYTLPTTQGAAGTVWVNNGSGVLTSSLPTSPKYNFIDATGANASGGTAYATTSSFVIPAGTMTASSTWSVQAFVSNCTTSTSNCVVYLRDIGGTTFATCDFGSNTVSNDNGIIIFVGANQSSLSSQSTSFMGWINTTGGTSGLKVCSGVTNSSFNTANALTLVLVVHETGIEATAIVPDTFIVNP